MGISSKKGSKNAKEVIDKHKKEKNIQEERIKIKTIREKFETSLDILFTMFWNLMQLKTGSRIGMTVSMDLTRETSQLFTERIDKFHRVIDQNREILNDLIMKKMSKYFDIFAPTELLTAEEFSKSEIALNILKEFTNKYNRSLSSFNRISVVLKQLTDVSKLEGHFKDPQVIKDKKFIEALMKLMVLISKPPKGIHDFYS